MLPGRFVHEFSSAKPAGQAAGGEG